MSLVNHDSRVRSQWGRDQIYPYIYIYIIHSIYIYVMIDTPYTYMEVSKKTGVAPVLIQVIRSSEYWKPWWRLGIHFEKPPFLLFLMNNMTHVIVIDQKNSDRSVKSIQIPHLRLWNPYTSIVKSNISEALVTAEEVGDFVGLGIEALGQAALNFIIKSQMSWSYDVICPRFQYQMKHGKNMVKLGKTW